MFLKYQKANIDLNTLLAHNEALKAQINSPEFNKPDNAYIKQLYENGKANMEQENAQDVFNKQQELKKEKEELEA